MSFRPTQIIIHHSLTKDSETVSWGAIRRYHTETLGWLDIGYHAGIEQARDYFECFYGRPTNVAGVHTRGQNQNSLGFCFVGNYDEVAPMEEMLRVAAGRVLAPWCHQYMISPRMIHPHSKYADYKTCPGTMFPMDELRSLVAASL